MRDRAIFLAGARTRDEERLGAGKEDSQNRQSVLMSENSVSEIVEPSDAIPVLIEEISRYRAATGSAPDLRPMPCPSATPANPAPCKSSLRLRRQSLDARAPS